jgi:hypothetical protein
MEKLNLNEFNDNTINEIKIVINELIDKIKELEDEINLLKQKEENGI